MELNKNCEMSTYISTFQVFLFLSPLLVADAADAADNENLLEVEISRWCLWIFYGGVAWCTAHFEMHCCNWPLKIKLEIAVQFVWYAVWNFRHKFQEGAFKLNEESFCISVSVLVIRRARFRFYFCLKTIGSSF